MSDDPQGAASAGAVPPVPQPLKKRGGRPPLLRPTPDVLERVHAYALQMPSKTDAAEAFGVAAGTFARFLRREPEAMRRWTEGQAERQRIRRLRVEEEFRATAAVAPQPVAPAPGENCPTCGQLVSGPEAVTLTQSEITNAAQEFDRLIDRHLAARKAPRGARPR